MPPRERAWENADVGERACGERGRRTRTAIETENADSHDFLPFKENVGERGQP